MTGDPVASLRNQLPGWSVSCIVSRWSADDTDDTDDSDDRDDTDDEVAPLVTGAQARLLPMANRPHGGADQDGNGTV